MAKPSANIEAARLQAHLRASLGDDTISVRPHGHHLLVQVAIDGEPDTVARLTHLDATTYTSGFRNHAGRWEPLPTTGTLESVADQTADILRPYLVSNKFTE